MIAITFALPAESSDFLPQLQNRRRVTLNGVKVIHGAFGGKDLEIIHTGVGTAIAQQRLVAYLKVARPSLLISSGFAGAARSNYRVADLILAENFSDNQLLATARRILREQNTHVVRLFTSPHMIDAAAEREEVAHQHGAIAIDMETEAIARECASHGVRLLSLRVLSDTPRHPFPLPPRVLFDLERQRTDPIRLAGYLVRHPGALPRLLRFAGQVKRTRHSLTEGLLRLLRAEL